MLLMLSACRPAAPTGDWHGRVVSKGQPVPEAIVRVRGTSRKTVTDAQGNFRLARQSGEQPPRITAAKPGYVIGGADADQAALTIELVPLPTQDNEAYVWVDPTPNLAESQNCGNCHREIFEQWQRGAHANAARNPHFLNLYAGTTWSSDDQAGWSLLRDYPEGAGVCTACHAPAASLHELGVADIRDLEGIADQGVHCDFCHKVRDVHLAAPGLTHGRFAMELLRPEHDQLFFGPLDDVDRAEDSWLPLMSESRYCAACHEGVVFGVPVYTTYSEWQESSASKTGKQCQTCHMQPDGKLTNIAPGMGGLDRDPLTLASHTLMPGGQQAMLRRCLDMTAMWHSSERHALRVAIATHDVGHRVPTGFVDRHVMLVVEAQDAAGKPIELLEGPRLPEAVGDLSGTAGALFAKLLRDPSGEAPVPFWQAGAIVEDTRLHPDRTHEFSFAFTQPPATVRVRLLYRRFWQSVAEEKQWPDETMLIHDQTINR
jgi:hypothetical protein